MPIAKNEATAVKRRVPVLFYDQNGDLISAIAFTHAAHEVQISQAGGNWIDASADAVEIGAGAYYVPLSAGEVNFDGSFIAVKLSKASYKDQIAIVEMGGVATLDSLQADTDDIQARIPAALVGGKMDSHVNDIANNAITAASIAADAIGASELAADAVTEIQTGLATAASITTMQTDVTRLLGLHRENSVLDGGAGFAAVQYSVKKVLVAARVRVFVSAAAANAATKGAANGADGEIARYDITGTDTGTGLTKDFKLTRAL